MLLRRSISTTIWSRSPTTRSATGRASHWCCLPWCSPPPSSSRACDGPTHESFTASQGRLPRARLARGWRLLAALPMDGTRVVQNDRRLPELSSRLALSAHVRELPPGVRGQRVRALCAEQPPCGRGRDVLRALSWHPRGLRARPLAAQCNGDRAPGRPNGPWDCLPNPPIRSVPAIPSGGQLYEPDRKSSHLHAAAHRLADGRFH